ncbi:hypothetical protein BEN78_08385 [Xanthomonas citri pv. mangiferaeindicae]|nr:hypothetical protein BEN78_08385 [Xanthomonas citri pv. mangiferaeindicae]
MDQSNPKNVDMMMCGPATEIYLPDPQRQVAPNVRLKHLQFMSPDDPCGRNFEHDAITSLQDRVSQIAASSLSGSKTSFSIMVQYTLTAGSPSDFEMRTMDAPEEEEQRLTDFYYAARKASTFQPSKGTVHVAIQYEISPSETASDGD